MILGLYLTSFIIKLILNLTSFLNDDTDSYLDNVSWYTRYISILSDYFVEFVLIKFIFDVKEVEIKLLSSSVHDFRTKYRLFMRVQILTFITFVLIKAPIFMSRLMIQCQASNFWCQ